METSRLPIGIQDFAKLRQGGFTYVDKTSFIEPLVNGAGYYFLSRPRRFGKSLFLSTLHAFFEGRRELFEGLAVDRADVDWTPHPVLHFDLNSGVYDDWDGLLEVLDRTLSKYEDAYGLERGEKTRAAIPVRFAALLEWIPKKTGRKVVVLIDEYDKPILGRDEEIELYERHQSLLKGFYGNLKSQDSNIRFVFVTGVARFSKVSIFSDVNHLDDISLDDSFADICGWTERELVNGFGREIEALAEKRKEGVKATLEALRLYYDGYRFTIEGSRLYNPYSVLKAFKSKAINPYWFDTGTPTFLAKRFKSRGIFPPDIDGRRCSRSELLSIGQPGRSLVPLMFQTGYLTIASYDEELQAYELRFPNREVETGFYENLIGEYVPETMEPESPFNITEFRNDLISGNPESFMRRLSALIKGLPYEDHCESTYRVITFLLSMLSGTQAFAESHSYKGRSDLEVLTSRYIYLIEFKYGRSVEEAMAQIRDRDYAGRYAMDKRQVYLIAANYSAKKSDRGLHYAIEPLK